MVDLSIVMLNYQRVTASLTLSSAHIPRIAGINLLRARVIPQAKVFWSAIILAVTKHNINDRYVYMV